MKYSICFSLILFVLFLNAQTMDMNYINYITSLEAYKVIGTGEALEKNQHFDATFDEVIIGNGIQLFLTPGDENSLKMVAQSNILPLVKAEIVERKLIISLSASLETNKGIKVYLPKNNLSKINIKEGAYLSYPKEVALDSIFLLLQSGALADCNVETKQFKCIVMGGAQLNLSGRSYSPADIVVKGGSVLNGESFECSKCKIVVLGASKCKLTIRNELNARVENESLLSYSGDPGIINQSTQLNGQIRRIQ